MKKFLTIISVAVLALSACTKQFEIKNNGGYLTGSTAAELVESDPEFLASYISGFYSEGVAYGGSHDSFGILSMGYVTDMMCQDVTIQGTWNWGTYDINHEYGSNEYRRTSYFWSTFFTLISKANEVIDFFGEKDPENAVLKGYLGQAYALRAFSYYQLLVYYQDPVDEAGKLRVDAPAVPLVFATRDGRSTEDVEKYSGRNKVSDVMAEIERNIDLALPLLNGYKRSSKNEIDYNVAQGIAARYFLYTQQWAKAATAAKAAQNGYDLMNQARLESGFMEIEDTEVLWGFDHSTETMTSYASFFSHMSNFSQGYGGIGQSVHCIDARLYNQIPATDYRKALFNGPKVVPADQASTTGMRYPYANYKFGYAASWLQDYIYMRNAEMILIEAEATARQGQDAKSILATLMAKRDPAWAGGATVEDILLQRRIELWGEGFEYTDLRRNGRGVNRTSEGTTHTEPAQLNFPAHAKSWNFQIPLSEINNNIYITAEENNPYEDGPIENA